VAPARVIAALPLGGRVKMDPWNAKLTMLQAKPAGMVAEREEMSFEVTPFILYLTRNTDSTVNPKHVAASTDAETRPVAYP
jgi:hypothetical protein